MKYILFIFIFFNFINAQNILEKIEIKGNKAYIKSPYSKDGEIPSLPSGELTTFIYDNNDTPFTYRNKLKNIFEENQCFFDIDYDNQQDPQNGFIICGKCETTIECFRVVGNFDTKNIIMHYKTDRYQDSTDLRNKMKNVLYQNLPLNRRK